MGEVQVSVHRLVWDSGLQSFVDTGQEIQGEVGRIEQLADALGQSAGRYLKGPVPWPWIVAAARLPGKALIVGLCLWRLAGAKRDRTVILGNVDLEAFAVDRSAKSRALGALERAGLINIARQPGRLPTITLVGTIDLAKRGKRRKSAVVIEPS